MPLDHLERYYTTRNLRRKLGRRHELDFLELGAMNISGWEDDFQGDLFRGGAAPGMYQSTASGAASATAAVSTGVVNGAALLDAGAANAGRSDLSWGLHYQAQLNAIYIARFSINVLTTRKFEIGFTDVISGTDAGAVNAKAGNGTWTAENAVVLAYDTDDDTNLTLMGVKATVAATSADFSTALSAATYYYFGVALFGDDNAKGFLLDADGALLEEEIIEDCVTADTLLTPWLFVQNRAANAGSMTLDWHKALQRRTTTV
jgi:hypothetical protein